MEEIKVMKFGCLTEAHNAEVRERPIPEMGDYDVMLKQLTNNICTTDYQQWMGKRDYMGYPMAAGHEGSGVVIKVGKKVTEFSEGDLVGVFGYGCDGCEFCKMGQESLCRTPRAAELTADGYHGGHFGFANYNIKQAKNLFKMNKDLDPAEVGFIEPLATVVKGIHKLRLQPLETVVVLGAGTMGLLNAQVARAYGAKVYVSELIEKKIKTAQEMGFEVIDASKVDPVEELNRLTNGMGVDCAIVAVGLTSANDQAMKMVKKIDGRILMFAAGYPEPELNINSNEVHYRRLEIIGTFGADKIDFAEAARMLNMRMVDVSKLIEPKRYPLSKIQDAYEAATIPGMYRVCVNLQE